MADALTIVEQGDRRLDQGLAGIIGASIGAIFGIISTLGATVLSEHLRNGERRRVDKIRRETLKELLKDDRYTWRTMGTLQDAIGADEHTTTRLLIGLKARRSLDGGTAKWALKSRVPLSE